MSVSKLIGILSVLVREIRGQFFLQRIQQSDYQDFEYYLSAWKLIPFAASASLTNSAL